jgi:hypothetical protein
VTAIFLVSELKQAEVTGAHVLSRCGKGMFGREPIFRHKRYYAGVKYEVPHQVAKRFRRTPVEPASMNVQNHCAWLSCLRPAPPPRNTTHGAGFKGHALRNSHVLHDAVERHARSSSL